MFDLLISSIVMPHIASHNCACMFSFAFLSNHASILYIVHVLVHVQILILSACRGLCQITWFFTVIVVNFAAHLSNNPCFGQCDFGVHSYINTLIMSGCIEGTDSVTNVV